MLDAAADDDNHLCEKYITKKQDALKVSWNFGGAVYCNPPYGRKVGDFVKKAFEESKAAPYPIVMLLASRTDTKYFHEYIYHKAKIFFLRGRLKFYDENGKSMNAAPFPSMIVVFNSKEDKENV